ncbi:hypothetical protein TWF696_003657 [Orbilia brochopaga]|uniref:Uncharacterized protein n=1 Tax=Orbilia brochopaga TaxID=3140254 RepID=A0AAV9V500_9PEZI
MSTDTLRSSKKRKRNASDQVPSDAVGQPARVLQEWPAHFKELAALHKALNLVYTFLCTRKQLATTFDNLRSAVEHHINRPLCVDDIVQIKLLIPDAVLFAYVSEDSLHIQMHGSDAQSTFKSQSAKDDPYCPPAQAEVGKQVLLFEFIDDDIKQKPKPRPSGSRQRRAKDLGDFKLPEFSHTELLRVISNRNDRFQRAIDNFLRECDESSLDPVESLKLRQEHYTPIKDPNVKDENADPSSSQNTTTDAPFRIPGERKPIPAIVREISTCSQLYKGQIVPGGILKFPQQGPKYGNLDFTLFQSLVDALYNVRNITQLYSHQAAALNDVFNGDHVVVSTSTSSGKSMIFQIPVLQRLEHDPECRALFIFPTKALAQDQKSSLIKMIEFMSDALGPVLVETYDGDTPMDARQRIREESRVVLTNPDMLHLNILPNEEQWRTFLKNLKFVVIDELHVYNGLFGSHVAFVMRRLRRICSAVGNNSVIFIACSATVDNPQKHMKDLIGLSDVKLTSVDGSPAGEKTFLCWNCPHKNPDDLRSGRVDVVEEAARLFVELILRGVRTIAFCRVRKTCELTLNAIKQVLLEKKLSDLSNRVMSYRGGYAAHDRRRIESEMFNGHLLGIVATTALELGIDIGTLDAVLMVGFPYSISNLRQQSGRAGRRKQDSLSVLIGDHFPLDQHYMSNPDLIKSMPNPSLHIDLENLLVLEGHLQCAAFEMPINAKEDEKYFGSSIKTLAEERLLKDKQGFFHCNERFRPYPSQHVAIRDTEDDHFAVVDVTQNRNVVLEQIEPSRAGFTIYEGAIFLHQGFKYLVREFNIERRLARVELVNVDWTTRQRDFTDIDPIETEATRKIPESPSKAFFGVVKIKTVVFGFFKIDRRNRILDACDVETPPIEIHSKGMWLDVPRLAFDILKLKKFNIAAAIHAAEHAILSLLPNFVISSVGDVRTECKAPQKEFAKKETTRKRPARLIFYDSKGGARGTGSGITTKAFEFVDRLLLMALERVEACTCHSGCPECVAAENCKEANAVISKIGSLVILRSLLNKEIDVDSLPECPDDDAPAGIETVILT